MSRVIVVLFAAAALGAGCGASRTAHGLTLGSILKRPGPNIGVTAGASEFVPGKVRFPFLVIANNAKPVERATASVWVAKSRTGKPFEHVTARLEPIGVPGRSGPAFGGVTRIYVAHLKIPGPGRYWLVAQPVGAKIQALGALPQRRRWRPRAALGDADAGDRAGHTDHDEPPARPAAPALLGGRLAGGA